MPLEPIDSVRVLNTLQLKALPFTQTDDHDAGNEKEAKKAAERELDPNRAPRPPPAPPQAKKTGPAATSRLVLTSTTKPLRARWTDMKKM